MSDPLPVSRIRLISPFGLALVGLAIVIPLILLFQSSDRLTGMLRSSTDSLSLRYVKLLVRMKPEDPDLRLMLVRKLKAIGYIDEARRTLAQLPSGENAKWSEAKRLSIQLDYLAFIGLQSADPKRVAAGEDLIRQLQELKGQGTPSEDLEEFARISLALNRPDLAAEFYLELSEADVAKKIQWLKESARWFIASGSSARAGLLLDQAASLSPVPEQSRALALEALESLLGTMAFDSALKLASSYLEKFPDDRVLASRSIDLALAANRLDLAKSWANKLASISGNDPVVLTRQLDIELAANDLSAALSTALVLIAVAPEEAAHRERLAQVATWTNRLELALEQRLWLVQHGLAGENLAEGQRLAKGTHNDQIWLMLTEKQAEQGTLSDQMLTEAEAVFQRSSSSEKLEQFLAGYVSRNPRALRGWIALARAQQRGGNSQRALATWARIDREFGATAESTIGQAEALWRMGRSEQALSLLKRQKSRATSEEVAFWRLLGALAWELEDDQEALSVYWALWHSRVADQADVERLISLLLVSGSAQEAIDTAQQAAAFFGEDRFLLQALQLALQETQWVKLEEQLAEASKSKLVDTESYWLIRAELMRHKKSWTEVEACYEQALLLNPTSVAARVGLLWTLIELREYPRLADSLRRWETDAQTDSTYWGAYAAGLAGLGRHAEALPWFGRQAAATPDNLLWLLSYADTLAQTGREDSAWRLRRHVLSKLMRNGKKSNAGTDRALQLAYARLLGEFGSADAESSHLRQLEAEGSGDPTVQEYLVGHYLAEQQLDAARHWLLKAHAQRQSLPAWQELALAVADHDEETVKRILNTANSGLDPVARVEGWKQVKDYERALAVARQSLEAEPDGRYSEPLRSEISELTERYSNQVSAGWRYTGLGQLSINEYGATLAFPNLPTSDWATTFKFARGNLSFSGDELSVAQFREETDLMASISLPLLGGKLEQRLGGNIRDDNSLIYALLSWTLPLSGEELGGKVEAGYNELPFETSYLRALGVKDSVSFQLFSRMTARDFARVKAEVHQFNTRDQDFLGRGYATEAEVGHVLLFEKPLWQIKLQGGWTANSLADTVPRELLSLGLSPAVKMSTIVPPEYGMLGIGNHIRLGLAPGPILELEGWAGYIWPAKELAYNVRLSAGTSLLTNNDRLSIEAFYANAQSGEPGQAYQGVGVFYQLAF